MSPAPHQAGIALLGAMMLVVIVVGIAASVGLRSVHDISVSTRLTEAANAAVVFTDLERQSQAALAADSKRGETDTTTEMWAETTLLSALAGGQGRAQLHDLQGRFNVNSLAFDPAGGGLGTGAGVIPPTPVITERSDGAGSSATTSALSNAMSDPSTDPSTTAQAAAEDGAAPKAPNAAAADATVIDPGMQALAMLPAVAAAIAATPSAAGATAPTAGATALVLTPQQVAIARFSLLLRTLDLDEALLPALLDWMDSDSDVRFPNGAEDDYYTELPVPYRTANQALVDVTELALVRGFDADVRAKLAPHIIALPGQSPINVNTADETVLMSLAPAMDASAAKMVINARQVKPFESIDQFMNLPVLFGRPLVAVGLATATTYFQLDMNVASGRSTTQARALLGRRDQLKTSVVQRSLGYLDE